MGIRTRHGESPSETPGIAFPLPVVCVPESNRQHDVYETSALPIELTHVHRPMPAEPVVPERAGRMLVSTLRVPADDIGSS